MASFTPRRTLIQLRVDRGLSRKAAAKGMGINDDTLKAMERGRPVRVGSLKRAADFYGVPPSELAPDLLEPDLAVA